MQLLTTKINNTFKAIHSHLNGLDSVTFKQMIKTSYIACYTITGEFLGVSYEPVGIINIQLNTINKTKKDIKRVLNLEKDYLMLAMQRAMLNELKK